ncbi:L,D-transpeptidase family protein [Sphingomonas sp. RG327]|uniref:L,D-transpeptidase family protein n=1 Tax=Sphingomonas anseongensis TaxID=2908207 RepID=A0ABT0RD76_9SPHN|nr:L,D-transpeptidase family protein [Sphingomonas anseongensis]MCL6678020.1 L,D-transpeptidase family protein [Sphingomonas anseongensis]
MRVGLKLLAAAAAFACTPAFGQSQPLEPIDLPPSIDQGVDLIYIDPEIKPEIDRRNELLKSFGFQDWTGAPIDLFVPVNDTYTALRRGLMKYKQRWGALPLVEIPTGPSMRLGSKDERVSLLRKRLGLSDGTQFDAALDKVAREYQAAHGMKADGIVGNGTVASLNLGADHYERLIILNMERARRLPAADDKDRYILVDAGAARLYMYENGKVVDSMNVIVGDKDRQTPMMAAELRYVQLNPYWNVPPDLSRTIVAKAVLAQGLTYLTERNYEVLSDWTDDAKQLDATAVDWQGVYDGKVDVRLRRGPGPWNSMGDMKFMIPNDFGIYLHDVPDAENPMFLTDDRWISNGCIRLQDAKRLEKWVFGKSPTPSGDPDERVDVPDPVPVYITYFTVAPTADGVTFRPDRYDRDQKLLARVRLDAPTETASVE